MHKVIAIIAGILVLLLSNYLIYSKERVLADGQVVRLELAPVDPRSLMQGDYMALRFEVADEAFGRTRLTDGRTADGFVVLHLDENKVGRFVRLDDGTPLADGEIRMRYRIRGGILKFATNAYFFQEGKAERYDAAEYGEFRVSKAGEPLLVTLLNGDLQPL